MSIDLIYRGLDVKNDAEREAIARILAKELNKPTDETRKLLCQKGALLCSGLTPSAAESLVERLGRIGVKLDLVRADRFGPAAPVDGKAPPEMRSESLPERPTAAVPKTPAPKATTERVVRDGTKVRYDPEIIYKFAAQLYAQADAFIRTCKVVGGLIGAIMGFLFLYVLANSWFWGIVGLIGGLFLGVAIGEVTAQVWAFQLRLKAQTTLCHVKNEENTREILSRMDSIQQPAPKGPT